jgi:hypothetical protein
MIDILSKIGSFLYDLFKGIQDAIDPEGKGGANVLLALAVMLPVLVIILLRKKIFKPTIRYRRKRAVKRTYRKKRKK